MRMQCEGEAMREEREKRQFIDRDGDSLRGGVSGRWSGLVFRVSPGARNEAQVPNRNSTSRAGKSFN